jgi:Kef-type K+ transport system membrane component KefB
MFLVGLELKPAVIRGQMRATVTTALASIAVPFPFGAALAVDLHVSGSSGARWTPLVSARNRGVRL